MLSNCGTEDSTPGALRSTALSIAAYDSPARTSYHRSCGLTFDVCEQLRRKPGRVDRWHCLCHLLYRHPGYPHGPSYVCPGVRMTGIAMTGDREIVAIAYSALVLARAR